MAAAALALELFRRHRRDRRREECDRQALELLFRLSARRELTESVVASRMEEFGCFRRLAQRFERSSRLALPDFGWRSRAAATAIRAALETGDTSVLTAALEQVSRQEEVRVECSSALASQKYTLVASIAVASAVLGVSASISGTSHLYYVVAQSVLSAAWLHFLGDDPYASLSLSLPLSLAGYFLALHFV